MSREPIPSFFFVLSVVRKDNRFLLVHERKHGQRWYFPAGRVEAGECFVSAAERETFEEAAVRIAVDGLIRIEQNPFAARMRMRLIFSARPVGDDTPKAIADRHSLKAGWFTIEEMACLPLRGSEVHEICSFVVRGGTIAPLTVLDFEGATFDT